jgi:hypothetical protein
MTPWAATLSDQKSGRADCFSSAAISFSLPAMSKTLQGVGYPVLQVGQFFFEFLHFFSANIEIIYVYVIARAKSEAIRLLFPASGFPLSRE